MGYAYVFRVFNVFERDTRTKTTCTDDDSFSAGVQALMGATSQSSEESPTSCDGTQKVQVLALARAIANSSPNPYDKDALKFNVRTTR